MLAQSYLELDIRNAGASGLVENVGSLDLDEMWDIYGEAIDYTRNTSFYGSFLEGFRKLYGFNDPYFTKKNISVLSTRIENNYEDYESWFDEAFHQAGFDLMFVDQFFNPFNTELDDRYFALVFHINTLIYMVRMRPEDGAYRYRLFELSLDGFNIENLADYLEFCNYLFGKNIESRALAVKNSLAYSRTLEYEDVPYETAYMLYEKHPARRTTAENKKMEDFMFHWIIQRCIEYDLPIQIHTGIADGDHGNPVKLNNLLRKYPDAKFVLFHGGFPWTGEYAMLGKQFRNVYLDLVWLPQLSREEAVSALDVMLDCVSYNRFFWGGDCFYIEESTGALEFGKDVVAEVLAKRIERGLLTEEVARDIIRKIFRENAIKVFKLNEKLGREF